MKKLQQPTVFKVTTSSCLRD